jgi:hypothetical protein
MINRDEEFRKWYHARIGTKSEGFAYDVWCAAWAMAKTCVLDAEPKCECKIRWACDFHDRCLKGMK